MSETERAVLVIRLSLDGSEAVAAVASLMRQVQPLLGDDSEAWIGIRDAAALVNETLADLGWPETTTE